MLREMLIGTAAGAIGTVALNAVTYGDMAVRGRPASNVPAQVAGKLADKAGADLSGEGEGSDDSTAQNRRSGSGALQGYLVGLGIGTAYGLIRSGLRDVSKPRAGIALGLAAMAGSDVPSTVLGVSDPTSWGLNSWLSDLVPHLAYGLTTAVAYDTLAAA
jgi:hypothetical protein